MTGLPRTQPDITDAMAADLLAQIRKGGFLSIDNATVLTDADKRLIEERLAGDMRAAVGVPSELRDRIYHIIASRFQGDPRETDFMYESVDLVLAAISQSPATEDRSRG